MNKTKTKLQIIEETAAAYANPANRAKSANGGCSYLTKGGRKCAVGRCFIKGREILGGESEKSKCPITSGMFVHKITNLEKILKPSYRGHEVSFWSSLQEFHDNDSNFTDEGISPRGVFVLKELREQYK